MEYILKKSNRKTISIRVTKNATLEVRAPKSMSVKSIERFLESKDEWITEHINNAIEKNKSRDCFALSFGTTINLRGNLCKIIPIMGTKPVGPIKSDSIYEIFLPDGFAPDQILDAVRKLLIEYAKDFLPKRTSELANIIKVTPTSVRVGKANSRWGSCNSQGRINFSWKIIMCDDSVVDYVIVHELCHLLHMNHSENFWREVQKYSPNYKSCRRILKEYSNTLYCENW